MPTHSPTQLPGDRLKKAIQAFAELQAENPGKDRRTLLQKVEIQFDLTPLECEFLHRQFLDDSDTCRQND